MSAMDGETLTPVGSIYWQFCIDYSPLLVCSLLIMPLFMLDFLKLTHRFVGPLVRIRESMLQLMENERVTNIKFRERDLLPELQSTFNDFLSFYDQQQNVEAHTEAKAPVNGHTMEESQAETLSSVLSGSQAEEPAEAAV